MFKIKCIDKLIKVNIVGLHNVFLPPHDKD